APGSAVDAFQFEADGSHVIYAADQDTPGVSELYRVPAAGGDATRLNGTLVAGGSVAGWNMAISRDGQTIAYIADQDVDEVFELYASYPAIDQPAPTATTGTATTGPTTEPQPTSSPEAPTATPIGEGPRSYRVALPLVAR
ncbi:MAG TPA: hypothetical protein VFT99_11200, partial [Roseiflexaceae bacterium]|nr:hypothetical protein [Roseiflexaceae bacterium]